MDTTLPELPLRRTFERKSPAAEATRRLLHHRSAQVGMVLLGILVFCAIFAQWIAPYDPIKPIKTATKRVATLYSYPGLPG